MLHLLEPTHNQRFIALMAQFMPQWRIYRDQLNHLPLGHDTWAGQGQSSPHRSAKAIAANRFSALETEAISKALAHFIPSDLDS